MVTKLARDKGCSLRELHLQVFGWPASFLDCSWRVPSKGFFGQGLTLALVLFPLASSDCYIYDSATGYYYDPLAGTYYDPNTQVSLGLCYFVNHSFIYIYFLRLIDLFVDVLGPHGYASFSLVVSGDYASLQRVGFSLQWLLLLPSVGSRHGASAVAAHRL